MKVIIPLKTRCGLIFRLRFGSCHATEAYWCSRLVISNVSGLGAVWLCFYSSSTLKELLFLTSTDSFTIMSCIHYTLVVFAVKCFTRSLISGSYSHSLGLELVRKDVAKYIHQRDGIESNWENIFLACGATEAVKVLFLRSRYNLFLVYIFSFIRRKCHSSWVELSQYFPRLSQS